MLSPYSDSNYKSYPPSYSGLSSYILRVVCVYGCTLYLPLVAQGIDLVSELRHILVSHDALALRNQCQ